MGPFTLAVDTKSSSLVSSDVSNRKIKNLQLQTKKCFASVSMEEEKPFDFLRILFNKLSYEKVCRMSVSLYVICVCGDTFACLFKHEKKGFSEGIIAGGTAGVVVETALYPIDTIKTRLQAGVS
ncbi:hypothetical protein GOBAR_DD05776 [Gossypium barbadense]|nr:hypothetical protein GOBAR_DD05776 [Gossypium barbadense]